MLQVLIGMAILMLVIVLGAGQMPGHLTTVDEHGENLQQQHGVYEDVFSDTP